LNISLLRQALKFKHDKPTSSQVEKLYKKASSYQSENDLFFITSKYRGRAEILNEKLFFDFLSDEIVKNVRVNSFEDIENILNAKTRHEHIVASGDSKNSIVRVFDNVVIFSEIGMLITLVLLLNKKV